MKMLEGLKNLWKNRKKDKEELQYPSEFLMVTYTKYAIEDGTEDDSNKIIIRYWWDKFDNRRATRYRYTPERLDSLRKVYRIPVHDKTKSEILLPIFAKLNPSEIKFLENA